MPILNSTRMTRPSSIDGVTLSRLFVGMAFTSVLLVSGDFWLFSLLGVKVEAQLLAYALVGVLGLGMILSGKALFIREPLFMLAVSLFLSSLFFRREQEGIFALALTSFLVVFLTATVFSLSTGYRNAIIKVIFAVFGVFAILGIIQSITFILIPETASYATARDFESSYLSGRANVHPLMFLGFGTGEEYELFGLSISRVSSFLKEPSFIVPYFVITGVLALSYRGGIRLWAVPLLTFAVISISGSAWISIILGIALLGPFWILKRFRRLWVIGPFLALGLAVMVISSSETHDILAKAGVILDPLKTEATFFEKRASITVRVESLKVSLKDVQDNYFGLPTPVPTVGGIFFYSLFASGYIGAILFLWVMLEYVRRLAYLSSKRKHLLFSAMMYGTLFQAAALTSGGFIGAGGFLLLALVLTRLRELMRETGEMDR